MELLYCWVANGFNVLVPKRRGAGFLAVPYGHHPNPGLDAIAFGADCDIFGLDGSLEFAGESIRACFCYSEKRRELEAIVVPMLESHYGLKCREIQPGEFWRVHPRSPVQT